MRILFAEDDRDLSRAVKVLLERSGYSVDAVGNGADALDFAGSTEYDCIILDWMMPVQDGVGVLKALREKGVHTPCMLLTARDAIDDRVVGLDAGADDYLPKPFATSELLARVRALLRRKAEYVPDILQFGDVSLDKATMEIRCGEHAAKLNNKAFQMMELFMENPKILFSVSQIMERVWGWDAEAEINVVWVNISYLRKKLAEIDAHVEIKAMRGAGYSLEKIV